MSVNNPGVIYDATNSWNGYNHQGKMALWYAISEITQLYDPTITIDQNKAILNNYFLEIEYMEDFSIGKTENGTDSYISVHQVKNRVDANINEYESALLGLLSHLAEYPDIELAVLHTTIDINLSSKPLLEHIKGFASQPQYLVKIENEIVNNRKKQEYRDKLTACKRGRPSTLKSNLKNALLKKYSVFQDLTESNLDEAFDLYLSDIRAEKSKLSSLSETQMNKVSICKYTLNGITTDYCPIESAVELLKSAIRSFYQKTLPGHYKTQNDFIDKSTLWILGKLDNHIIERDLHFDLYKKGTLDRRIVFSDIYDWLMSDDIDHHGPWYYLHYIKEGLFAKLERYCKVCRKRNIKCSNCNVTECKNKLGCMNFDEFKQFVHVTNPTVADTLDRKTYHQYLTPGITSPFAQGLRDIPKPFESKQNAISYKDSDSHMCALTTIAGEGSDDDSALISSEILRNSNIYDLLMDYGCLISKDINISSIMEEEILQNHCFDPMQSEHIAHCKDVKVVSLDEFIASL